ncbi:MAG: hypothetical protein IKT03_00510 [Muribaculaceae bacterium]|nr:hypothetical protein [Muribaculaceae bacterium]
MKRIFLIALLGLVTATAQAQIPTPPDPVCAYCGVNLKKGEAHKSTCRYYEAPKEEESSSSRSSLSSSTKLKDYTPLSEVKSRLNVSREKYEALYKVGVGDYMMTCPHCGSVVHERWCPYAMLQKMANDAKAKALAATTREERKEAMIDFHVCEDNLLASYEQAIKGNAIVEPEYESVKVVVAQHGSEMREFYDVTQRDGLGMLRHGLINRAIVSGDNLTIPCVCDRIELIDRSPLNRGVLAKITVDGRMGIMDADSGDVLIQPGYSYVNTYFTPKGMYFIVGDGIQFGAYFAETMEIVVSPDSGKTLDQVRDFLDRRDK